MSLVFHRDAEIELNDAISYYEDTSKELAYDFTLEVFLAIERIEKYPEAWSLFNKNVRRALVKRFPYAVLYIKQNERIIILAIMNLHRDPTILSDEINRRGERNHANIT